MNPVKRMDWIADNPGSEEEGYHEHRKTDDYLLALAVRY
jgi:hypothetical protein